MDSLLSPSCSTTQQQKILTSVLTRLREESSEQQWVEKQNAWNSNYASVLVELIGRLVWVFRTQAEEQLQAEMKLLGQALQLLQGLLLLHRPSAQLFERKSNIEILLYLLNNFSQSANEIPILVLDTFLCILADRPKNIRAFEEYDGVEQVVKLLRAKEASKAVRIKCLEVLYFYLLPESSSTPSSPLPFSGFPQAGKLYSPLANSHSAPASPNKRSNHSSQAMDGLKSLLERTDKAWVPRTPRKIRPVAISGSRKQTAIHIPSEVPEVPAILRSGSENSLLGKEKEGKEQIPPTPRNSSRVNSRSSSDTKSSSREREKTPVLSTKQSTPNSLRSSANGSSKTPSIKTPTLGQKTPLPSSKKTAALSSAPRLPGSDSPFLTPSFVPGHKSSHSEPPLPTPKRSRPTPLPLGSSTNLHAFDTPPTFPSSASSSNLSAYATPPMSASSTPRSDRSANALSRSRAAREQFSPRKSAVHAAKPSRLAKSERSTSSSSFVTAPSRKASDERGVRSVEEKKKYLENHLGNVDDLMGHLQGLGLRSA